MKLEIGNYRPGMLSLRGPGVGGSSALGAGGTGGATGGATGALVTAGASSPGFTTVLHLT